MKSTLRKIGLLTLVGLVTVVAIGLFIGLGSGQYAYATDLWSKKLWWGKTLATQGSCGVWGGNADIPSSCWNSTWFNNGEYAFKWLGSDTFYCDGAVRLYMNVYIPQLARYDDWEWTFGVAGADNDWSEVLVLDYGDLQPGTTQHLTGSRLIPGGKTFDRMAVGALRSGDPHSAAYSYNYWLKVTCTDHWNITNTPRPTPGPTQPGG